MVLWLYVVFERVNRLVMCGCWWWCERVGELRISGGSRGAEAE